MEQVCFSHPLGSQVSTGNPPELNNFDWTRNKNNGKIGSVWETLPARLTEVGQRLKRVQVERLAPEDILRRYDSSDTLFCVAPPLLPENRVSGERYTQECSRDDHIRLLRIARGLKSSVAICGCQSDLYDELLDDWKRTDFGGKSCAGPRAKGRKLPRRVLSVYTKL